jgi:hypothetical protein
LGIQHEYFQKSRVYRNEIAGIPLLSYGCTDGLSFGRSDGLSFGRSDASFPKAIDRDRLPRTTSADYPSVSQKGQGST